MMTPTRPLLRAVGPLAAVVFAACAESTPPPAPPPPPPAAAATAAPAAPATAAAPATPAPAAEAASAAPAPSAPAIPESIHAAVSATDRTAQDRELDTGRHPEELLAFADIKPGMHVAEIGAGTGYTTELLARAVGPTGKVYSQNTKFVVEKFAGKPWSERLAKPELKNVVKVVTDGKEPPLPPDAKDLDAVFVVLIYHDLVWLGADRQKLNHFVLDRLKPGGEYIIVDHSAKSGSGLADVKTLHRIDEKSVTDEITAAGFHLSSSADFLRNPSDQRDWNDSPMVAADRRGKSDRFVLKFAKP